MPRNGPLNQRAEEVVAELVVVNVRFGGREQPLAGDAGGDGEGAAEAAVV
jgi:hypothetical protein